MRKAKKKRNKTRSPLRTNLIFDYIYFSFILSAFPFLSSRPLEFSFSVRCYPCTATLSSLFMYTVDLSFLFRRAMSLALAFSAHFSITGELQKSKLEKTVYFCLQSPV